MNATAFRDWVELVGLVVGWVVIAATGWNKLVNKINGVGSKVNALEISVGSHETSIDHLDSELRISTQDRKQLFKEVGEFKAEMAQLNKSHHDSDEKNNALLTAIQVNLGRLDTKVDILLKERNS